jgi:hypothetical protein
MLLSPISAELLFRRSLLQKYASDVNVREAQHWAKLVLCVGLPAQTVRSLVALVVDVFAAILLCSAGSLTGQTLTPEHPTFFLPLGGYSPAFVRKPVLSVCYRLTTVLAVLRNGLTGEIQLHRPDVAYVSPDAELPNSSFRIVHPPLIPLYRTQQ